MGCIGCLQLCTSGPDCPTIFQQLDKKINKVGHTITVEAPKAHPAFQDLACLARNVAWAGGGAAVSAVCAAAATRNSHPCGAETQTRKVDNLKHQAGLQDAQNHPRTCPLCWAEGRGGLGVHQAPPGVHQWPQPSHNFSTAGQKKCKVGHRATAEAAKVSPAVQDLASFAKHIAWAGGCAAICAGCKAVAAGSPRACSAETMKRKVDDWKHQVGAQRHRTAQELVSCIELKVWVGWGAPGASSCAPVATTIQHSVPAGGSKKNPKLVTAPLQNWPKWIWLSKILLLSPGTLPRKVGMPQAV